MTMTDDVALARDICNRCFAHEARIEPLGGPHSAVFRLRFDTSAHVLKLARDSTARALRKEHMLLALLARYGIPVPRVEFFDLDGSSAGRPYLMLADAGELRVADYLQVHTSQSRALCREMGELLARIHTLVMSGAGDLQPEGYVARDAAAYRERLHALARWAAAQALIAESEADAFCALPLPDLHGTSLCHGDFHAVQCIVHAARVSAI